MKISLDLSRKPIQWLIDINTKIAGALACNGMEWKDEFGIIELPAEQLEVLKNTLMDSLTIPFTGETMKALSFIERNCIPTLIGKHLQIRPTIDAEIK